MRGLCAVLSIFLGGTLPRTTHAHGRLTIPEPRSTRISGGEYSTSDQNAPTGNSPLDENFVCRNTVPSSEDQWLEVEAGSIVPMQWELTAKHIGDCFIYISCTPDVPDLEKEWFKIADVPYCRDPSKEDLAQALDDGRTDGSLGGPLSGVPVNILIPDFLPPSPHCILRWEWYALHQVTQVEYYAQCVDIVITSNTNGVAEATPLPTFQIGDDSFPNLRNPFPSATQNYRQGFVTGNQFLSSDIPLVSPGGDGSALPTPPAPTPPPNGGDGDGDGDSGDTGGGEEVVIDDGGGLCFRPNTPLLDADIDASQGRCGQTTRCETGQCCSSAGFCGTSENGYCTENSLADYRPIACSSISNPTQELVGYQDVVDCVAVFCGDILDICNSEEGCAAEWATVDSALQANQNICGSFGDSLSNNFAVYSLQCSCDNCGALASQLAGGDSDGGVDVAVIAGAAIGVTLLAGLVIGGVVYARKSGGQSGPASKKPMSTEITWSHTFSTGGRQSRGKSWMNETNASSVV